MLDDWGDALPAIPARRITLRRVTTADASDLFGIFSDAEVMRYWDGVPMVSLEDAYAYITDIDEGFRARTLFQWGIALAPADRVIGTCTLLHVSAAHRRGEIGFALGRAHWGYGYAAEAVDALLRFAFEQLSLHRLEADVDPRNERSLRLLERFGFRREGYLRQRYQVAGELQDSVVLGLLRGEWTPAPARGSPG